MIHIKILTALVVLYMAATARAQPAKTEAAGDSLPPGVLARLGSSRFTHSANVDHVAFTADGKTVVFVGRDSAVSRWDVAEGKELGHFQLQPFGARNVLLSPDGSTVVQARSNQMVAVLDAATGKERFTISRPFVGQFVLGWGKGGQTLLVGAAQEVRAWDVAARRELAQWKLNEANTVAALAGSADGTRVAIYSNDTGAMTLHDAATGKVLQTFPRPGVVRRGRLISETLSFSPDGKKLLDWSASRTVFVWDVATGKRLPQFNSKDDRPISYAAAWSPDGRFLAVGGNDSTVRLLDANTGKPVKTLTSVAPVRVLRFSPDGRFLAGLGNSPCPELWDVATSKSLAVKTGHRGAVLAVAFTAPGRVVTGGADARLMEWDLNTGRLASSFGSRFGAIRSLAAAGAAIAYCQGGDLKVWKPGATASGPLGWQPLIGMESAVSADGRVYACSEETGKVQCYETASGKKLGSIPVNENFDPALFLSSDGRYLALRGETDDGTFLRVVRTSDGRAARTLPTRQEYIAAVAFAPNGRTVAAVEANSRLRVWEMATGADYLVPIKTSRPTAVTFSPNSRTLFIGCSTGQVFGYDLISGELSGPHAGHRAMIDVLAVSPDGATLVTGSTDTTALVWTAAAVRPKGAAAAAPKPGDLERWWKDLVAPGGDAVRSALGGLAGSPKDALPFLKEHLKPPPLPSRDQIAGWVRDLDSQRFAVREKASRALAALGEDATDILTDAQPKAATPEGRRRIELLLRDADGVLSAPNLQLLRGLEALELIGGLEARAVLDGLVKTAEESWLKREARMTLARMSR